MLTSAEARAEVGPLRGRVGEVVAHLEAVAPARRERVQAGAQQGAGEPAPAVQVLDTHGFDESDARARVGPEHRVAGHRAVVGQQRQVQFGVVEGAVAQARFDVGAVAFDHRVRAVLLRAGDQPVPVGQRPRRGSVGGVEPAHGNGSRRAR